MIFSKETVVAITILYKNTKVIVRSPDGDTNYFVIVIEILRGDSMISFFFNNLPRLVLRTSIDLINERKTTSHLKRQKSKRYPPETITDADYADDLALLVNTPAQAESLARYLEQAARSTVFYMNSDKI